MIARAKLDRAARRAIANAHMLVIAQLDLLRATISPRDIEPVADRKGVSDGGN